MDFFFGGSVAELSGCWGPFLKSPETLRAIFGCHNSLCNSRTESIWFIKLQSYFSFCCLENMLKDRLSKTSGWQFYIWLFGSETFSGLSRNGPLDLKSRVQVPLWPLAGFVPGSPWLNSSAALVCSQLVCLLPVGILNLFSLFQSGVPVN